MPNMVTLFDVLQWLLTAGAGHILGNLVSALTVSVSFLGAIAQAVWTYATRTITSCFHLCGTIRRG